jgi:hypothetical protein
MEISGGREVVEFEIQTGLPALSFLRLRCCIELGNPRIHVLDDGPYECDRQRVIKTELKQGSLQVGAAPADSDYLVLKVHGEQSRPPRSNFCLGREFRARLPEAAPATRRTSGAALPRWEAGKYRR